MLHRDVALGTTVVQAEGFDLQITGFGLSSVYHADNEYISLQDCKDAFLVLFRVISEMETV